MRLFVGLDISAGIREAVGQYVQGLQRALPNESSRWVKPESLHVTLKFIGESQKAGDIEKELRKVKSPAIAMTFAGVGFFTPKVPRIFWAGVNVGAELFALASDIDSRLVRVAVPKEPHAYEEYQPHVTLARTGSGRPSGSARDRNKPGMWALQELVKNQPQPEFGTMTAEEFILYRSETLPGGSRYTALAKFPLR